MDGSAKQPKKLKAKDLFLSIIVLMLFLDTAMSSSTLGFSTITWYLLLTVIFFLPMALITSELGSSYPSDGGLYHWVKISLGANNATRVSWYYWVNCAIWCASMPSFIMDLICQMINVLFGIEIPFVLYLVLCCVSVWIFIFITMQPSEESSATRNLGGIVKLGIVIAMVLCAIAYLVKNGGSSTPFVLSEMQLTIGSAFAFFPAVVYNIVGFDAVCSIGGSNITNPGRDIPRMILLSLGIMLVVYILFTLAICIVTPAENIDIISGIANMFLVTFPGTLGVALYTIVGIALLYSLISQIPAWLQASGFMAIEAASDENRELPKVFATLTKKGGPKGSPILQGIVGTSMILIYGILTMFVGGSAADLFWTLFSLVSIFFMIPFLMLCSAFIKLRKIDPTKRAFRFPGSDKFAFVVARFCQIVVILTLVIFFWVPGQPIDVVTTLALVVGTIVCLLLGEFFNMKRKKAMENAE